MSYVYIMCISLLYSLVLNILFFKKSHVRTRETKYYSTLLVVNLFSLFFEIFCTIIGYNFPPNTMITVLFTKVFMCFLTSFVYLISLYINSLCFADKEKIYNAIKLFLTSILIVSYAFIFYLPIITSRGYATGRAVDFVFIVGTLFLTSGIVPLLFRFKKINSRKIIPFLLFILFTVITAFIQQSNPEVTLTTSIECLVIFVMYFTIENPDLKIIEELTKARILSEKTNNEKANFLFTVTDEIQGKIAAIDSISDELLNLRINADAKNKIYEIKRMLDIAKNKIKKTIDISDMDSKLLRTENNTYDIELLVNSVYLKTKALIKKDVDYRININGVLPKELYGDSIKIKQIITTILNNSIEHTSKGFIELRVSSIVKNETCRLIISVEDSGNGIDIVKQNEILSNHDDLNNEDLKLLNSMDLNLKTIRKMINLIGGTFTIDSTKDNGCLITVTLDQRINFRQKTNEEEKMLSKFSEDFKNRKNCAIIVRDGLVVKTLKSILKNSNYQINLFEIAKNCLDEIRNGNKYDLIFIEEDMEKINAEAFLKKVKLVENFSGKIVMITKTKNIKVKKELLKLGFAGIVSYPLDKDEILKKIENL